MEELAAANRQALALLLTGDRKLWTIVAISFSVSLRAILIAALVAAFGRIIAEVGSSMMVGGNILGYTRNIPTAIALETSKGEFAQGIALGLALLLLALCLNFALTFLQGKGNIAP